LPGGRSRIWAILCVLVLALTYPEVAGAESTARTQLASVGGSPAGSGQAAVLGARVEEITAVGDELERAQSRAEDAKTRVGELGRQSRQLEKQIAEQDRLFHESRKEYRDRARAAYKGQSLEGFVAILDGWFGLGGSIGWDPTVAAVLLENQQSLLEYEEAGRDLRNTRRQISQKQNDYSVALEEQQAASAELRRREQALDQAVDWLSTGKERTQTRLHELEAIRSGARTRPPGGRDCSTHLPEGVHGPLQSVGQRVRVRTGLVRTHGRR
jgi:chromosome segregation ATPase